MPEPELSLSEIAEIISDFGGQAQEIKPNPDEMAVYRALQTIRDHLMVATDEEKAGVNDLARRLGISPSSVSRFLGGGNDMRVSTMVLYGRALGREWDFYLRGNPADHPRGNYNSVSATMRVVNANGANTAMETTGTNTTATNSLIALNITTNSNPVQMQIKQ